MNISGKIKYFVLGVVGALAVVCASQCIAVSKTVKAAKEVEPAAKEQPLKRAFPFKLGIAVNQAQHTGKRPKEEKLIKHHFNIVTAENCMKSMYVEPEEGVFKFDEADRFVAWAQANGFKIVGHVLVWHEQLPFWFCKDSSGNLCSREILLKRMETYITTVMHHFKGKVDIWDVANEAILDDGTYRDSDFHKILGDEFIDEAFRIAQAADPDVELWYTDYNNDKMPRNETIVQLVRRLKSKGLRIDGVGMQTHIGLTHPKPETYEKAIEMFVAEGVKVAVTEFDMTVLPAAWDLTADLKATAAYDDAYNPWPWNEGGLPDDMEKKEGERYKEWFAMFRRQAKNLDRVTVWGLSDGDSWLNNFPVKGRTDYPLLFDRHIQLKSWATEL